MSQLEEHLSLIGQADAILRYGRPERVAAHPLQPRPIPSWHDDRGMEIEPVVTRVT
jgi:hypothetical protein